MNSVKLITALLAILGMALFICYLIYALKKAGIPTSISKTYYLLNYVSKSPKKGWMFQVALISLGFLLQPGWVEASSVWSQFLCFLASASIIFVGAAAKYLNFVTGKVHVIATAVAASASVLWTVFAGKWFWIIPAVCLIAAVVLFLHDRKNKIFYFECAAFLSAFVSILIKLIIL